MRSAVATSTGSSWVGSMATWPVPGTRKMPPTPIARADVALDVEGAGEVLQAGVALAADEAQEAEHVGGQDHVDRLVDAEVWAGHDLAAAQLEPVPLQEPVAALEVEADDAVQEREPLGNGVLVEPGEDHLDRDRADLVAPDQGHEVVVGGRADRRHQVLGRDRQEEARGQPPDRRLEAGTGPATAPPATRDDRP